MSDPFTHDRFAEFWDAFCDGDRGLLPDNFIEDADAHGLIVLEGVSEDDLEQAFATERGIEKGGQIWRLTDKGLARYNRAHATPDNESSHGLDTPDSDGRV